jgi:hypothetical protein
LLRRVRMHARAGLLAEIVFQSLDGISVKMAHQVHSGSALHDTSQADLYGGIALSVATLAALLIANSSLGPRYTALFEVTGEIRIGSIGLSKSLEHWINGGLMAVFFLLVGLEIKREAFQGELASLQKAALPVIAAAGGFVVPAAIYVSMNWGDAQALRGWAVPSATDIAFAIGICALLGRVVPASLKTFLLALAIIDDLMAIVVIAVLYTDELSIASLVLAGNRRFIPRRAEPARRAPVRALYCGLLANFSPSAQEITDEVGQTLCSFSANPFARLRKLRDVHKGGLGRITPRGRLD